MLFHSFLICLLENPVFSVRILLSIIDFGIGLIWRLYNGRELSRYSSLKLFSIALLVLLSRSIVQMLYSADFTSRYYMGPELLIDLQDYDYSSDMRSLGCLFP
ncbi:hypothetical protein Vadar_023302 [Vaccinium darrowii]|uniref:Uncharacterized protein n=1 Tax=Vaccinium darrowii TaxID=229202 RepID=A0ACB7Y0Z3_9ERIC|nr:hypothetical protein Vadar_023302 [Vaccinium darrowii]